MKDQEIIQAVKDATTDHIKEYATGCKVGCEQDFCEYNGTPTINIANKLGLKTLETRRVLERLCGKGLLLKSVDNQGRYARWWPVGYHAELKNQQKG